MHSSAVINVISLLIWPLEIPFAAPKCGTLSVFIVRFPFVSSRARKVTLNGRCVVSMSLPPRQWKKPSQIASYFFWKSVVIEKDWLSNRSCHRNCLCACVVNMKHTFDRHLFQRNTSEIDQTAMANLEIESFPMLCSATWSELLRI